MTLVPDVHVTTTDVPNTFMQTEVDTDRDEMIVIKTQEALTEMLEEVDPVKHENEKKTLCAAIRKSMCGMSQRVPSF